MGSRIVADVARVASDPYRSAFPVEHSMRLDASREFIIGAVAEQHED